MLVVRFDTDRPPQAPTWSTQCSCRNALWYAHAATAGRADACAPPPRPRIAGRARFDFPQCSAGFDGPQWIRHRHSPPEAHHKKLQNHIEPKIKILHLRKSTETTQNQLNRPHESTGKRLAQVGILITPLGPKRLRDRASLKTGDILYAWILKAAYARAMRVSAAPPPRAARRGRSPLRQRGAGPPCEACRFAGR